MPARKVPLVTDEYYHVVNRGVGSIPIFNNARNYQRFISTFQYYQNQNPPTKFSLFTQSSQLERKKILGELKQSRNFLVEIIAYCLMPNHYHFLLKQTAKGGILNFIRLATDSYSRYFNLKNKRTGALFGSRFKAIRVETEEQLLHLSRYIHLNPYSGLVVKKIKDLLSYPYSSLAEYLTGLEEEQICQRGILNSYFKKPKDYREFILDQADYQKRSELIKHQLLE